ncbi:MAG: hypothetical protein M3512_06100, partial [Bacteroidota bacterium]|nr:hypothetical protein [Bacteroidota bacterium]
MVGFLSITNALAQCPEKYVLSKTPVRCFGERNGIIDLAITDGDAVITNYVLYNIATNTPIIINRTISDDWRSVRFTNVRPGPYYVLVYVEGCGDPDDAYP